ncbi:surface antigen (D15) [Fimbriimonas ginsengisoli Gsoil 348]|uniref:Surface antigen (D15) n=2 Tax=Fimbriimonas ginsengisoli TaxID=1005039 RepID=A0A068NR01_FIMGI|nr:surface antigen (D15) [Fimbriimonas ginsengisoli Gsoil 348]
MSTALLSLAIIATAQAQTTVVKEIVIQGNRRVSREAILAAMRTKVGQPYVQENLDRDQRALDDLGFFEAVSVRPSPLEGNSWRITVDLTEWPEVKEIRVVGNSVIKTEDILNVIKPFIKPGDVYNLNSLRPASDAIRSLYSKKGFFLAAIEEFAPLKESPNTVNIALVETRVGTVSVQGARATRDSVIRRLIKTRSGDPYSENKWVNDLRRLYNTSWFESVTTSIDPEREAGKVDLTANVKETKTGQFNVGLQLDPRNKLAGVIRLSDTNFRGTGQTVGINYIQATQGSGPSVDLDYVNPFFDSKDTALRVSIYSRLVFRFANVFSSSSPTSSSSDYNERRTGGSIGFSRPVGDSLSYGLSVRYENVKTNNVSATGADRFIQQDGDVGVASLGFIRNRRDRDIDATRGDWLKLDVEPGYANITDVGGAAAGTNVIGTHTFFRTNLEFRKYFTDQGKLTPKDLDAAKRVLALRAKVGSIQGTVPFFEQFFAGGADTLRGYPEDRFWGRNQLLTTAEVRYPIQKAFSIIGFVDYGGAWGGYNTVNDFTQSAGISLHLGYGMGLSFRTPLGPIRVDLGFDERGKSRTHFLIGTSF